MCPESEKGARKVSRLQRRQFTGQIAVGVQHPHDVDRRVTFKIEHEIRKLRQLPVQQPRHLQFNCVRRRTQMWRCTDAYKRRFKHLQKAGGCMRRLVDVPRQCGIDIGVGARTKLNGFGYQRSCSSFCRLACQ